MSLEDELRIRVKRCQSHTSLKKHACKIQDKLFVINAVVFIHRNPNVGGEAKFRVMDAGNYIEHPQMMPSVVLTGTANKGSAGPSIGCVDIGVNEKAYLFRVSLPGIQEDQNKLRCDIRRSGKIRIQGFITGGAILNDSSSVFQMGIQQLCPPGPFTVTFNLPGPVDPRLFAPTYRPDGILEVVVMKYRFPTAERPHS